MDPLSFCAKPECHGLSIQETKICWSWASISTRVFQKELIKLFRSFPTRSSVCHRWQTHIPWSNIPHRSPAISWSPQGFFHPWGPWARRVWPPQGIPRIWKQLAGIKLSGHEWVWSDHSCASGNITGINLAPWLCSVGSTAGIYKQAITHWMLSCGSRAKIPGHAKEIATAPKGRGATFTVCFSPNVIFNH